MNKEAARDIVHAIINADEKISQLLIDPLEYESIKNSNEPFEKEVFNSIIESIKINHHIIWTITEKFPDIKEEIDKEFNYE